MVSWTIRACGILFSLIAFVAAWNGFAENRRFSNHGQRVLVEPIEKYTETTTTKKKLGVTVGESKSQSAQMFFTTLDKRRIAVNRNLPSEVLSAFKSGADVYIEYLPEEPSTTRFPGHGSSPVLTGLIGLLVGLATWFFWRKV